MLEFQVGQDALDVCKVIIDHYPNISVVRLIAHEVGINWRQRYQTSQGKLEHMGEGFEHPQPLKIREYSRREFSCLSINSLYDLPEKQVWSITSQVKCIDGKIRHIPMANFHPEKCSYDSIKKALKYICGDHNGVLLDSGRFQHYYGNFLFEEDEWIKFMAELLMPTLLVSPRYVGHRLYVGYCSLRITTDSRYKPQAPRVVEIL